MSEPDWRRELRRVKVMAEYSIDLPLWIDRGPSPPISDRLHADLTLWCRWYQANGGPDEPEGDEIRSWARWNLMGLELARRVRSELDESWLVSWFDDEAQEERLILEDDTSN